MSKTTEDVEARAAQRDKSKRATFDLLKGKKRAERTVEIVLVDGEDPVSMEFRAIGAQEYDRLIAKNPPNTEQKAEGSAYNIHNFGPALLSAVCVDPDMTRQEWSEIWNSPDWNRGEVMQMFLIAVELCNKGLDLPFNGTD
jgi:hypothetical protein